VRYKALEASFRVFGKVARSDASPRQGVLFSDWLLVQRIRPAEVSPVLVR
jgi:hypothetical protein